MQSLAFLWFQLQMTQQYLHEKTFGPVQPPANSANLNTPIGRCNSDKAQYSNTPALRAKGFEHEHEAPYQNRSLHRDSCLCPAGQMLSTREFYIGRASDS